MKNYENKQQFIEAVEKAAFWNDIEADDYREALEEVGLDYDSYDDPDEMWEDYLEAVKNA